MSASRGGSSQMPFLLAEQRERMEPDESSVLAQRAASEGPRWTRAVEDQSASIPKRDNEQAWREHVYRSMRAVKGSPGHSF
jgi:hypothetical protein